jgi:hypothetical protein
MLQKMHDPPGEFPAICTVMADPSLRNAFGSSATRHSVRVTYFEASGAPAASHR